MKSTLAWVNDELVWTTTKKRRVIAKYVGKQGKGISLQTPYMGMNGFIGEGKSATFLVLVETYWSRVDGETYLVQFDPQTGDTLARPDSSNNLLTCRRV
jgi:hypothetical protein